MYTILKPDGLVLFLGKSSIGGSYINIPVPSQDYINRSVQNAMQMQRMSREQIMQMAKGRNRRRPALIIFINGLPIVLFEFKNLFDIDTTVDNTFNQKVRELHRQQQITK